MFIIELATTDGLDDREFLGIKTLTLCRLGAKDSYLLKDGQIHRWILPTVLHTGFLHILYNCVFQLLLGTLMEALIGPVKVFFLYIAAGIGGNLMSALANDSISAGASTSCFGITGAFVAFLIVNWVAMENLKEIRCLFVCVVIMIVLFSVLLGLQSDEKIDNFGHLGGGITGIFIGMALMIILPTSMNRHQLPGFTYERICKTVGAVVGLLYLAVGLIGFYAGRNPKPACPL